MYTKFIAFVWVINDVVALSLTTFCRRELGLQQ